MEFFKQQTKIKFLDKRLLALILSSFLLLISIISLALQGLNFGIDFSGGTLVEVGYAEPVEIESVRSALQQNKFDNVVVQHFGTSRDILVRLPSSALVSAQTESAADLSAQVIQTLRTPYGEVLAPDNSADGLQQCLADEGTISPCQVQMRRVEFVGPQVGDELTNQGGLAVLYALLAILIYVTFRFEWRFAIGSVIALLHDVIITLGIFSVFQFDFSLSVLAAVLAVVGYSLNDTIVVYDRIRENFRKIRKHSAFEIINTSINQTLPRTVLTSLTTLIVVLILLIFGGEVIRGFSIALLIGVIVGTYSSIFVASPMVLVLGITREDMIEVKKEGADATSDQL